MNLLQTQQYTLNQQYYAPQQFYQIVINDCSKDKFIVLLQQMQAEGESIPTDSNYYATINQLFITFSSLNSCYCLFIMLKKRSVNCQIATITEQQSENRIQKLLTDQAAGDKARGYLKTMNQDTYFLKDYLQDKDNLRKFVRLLKQKI